MVNQRIITYGKILFEPENLTRKHNNQASWKKMAMVLIDGDLSSYYAWFIKKRYNLVLNPPQRGPHVSFINDSVHDLSQKGRIPFKEVNNLWDSVKEKWDGKQIEIILDVNAKTDSKHWWLNIPHEERLLLQSIREELGLGKPFWGMHMSIGYANEKNIYHSEYIHDLIKNGFITT